MKNKYSHKLVVCDTNSSDEFLCGFYTSRSIAELAKVEKQFLLDDREFKVKPINPDEISNPISSDYSHYVRSLIPNGDYHRVIHSDAAAEINCNFLGFIETYYRLSKIIPKDFTIIDIGCAYNAQAYLFQDFARYIAIDVPISNERYKFERFIPKDTEFYELSAKDFIGRISDFNINLDKTFAICNYATKENEDVRKTFKNLFVFFP